jgi:hypothetical protein
VPLVTLRDRNPRMLTCPNDAVGGDCRWSDTDRTLSGPRHPKFTLSPCVVTRTALASLREAGRWGRSGPFEGEKCSRNSRAAC